MLRITIVDTPTRRRLVLEGRLTPSALPELKTAWAGARRSSGTRTCLIDLSNTTFIDEGVEGLLLDMKKAGARFIACGVSNIYRLERLGISCRGPVGRNCGR